MVWSVVEFMMPHYFRKLQLAISENDKLESFYPTE